MSDKGKKKLEPKIPLVDVVFSWSLDDVLNKNLYKDKVQQIPETFQSIPHYFKCFINPLIEETHADLLSNLYSVHSAPVLEVFDVKISKGFKPPKELFYNIILKSKRGTDKNVDSDDSVKTMGAYEPGVGDLIAFTDIKPKSIHDLKRPEKSYNIGFVRKNKYGILSVLSSKPIVFQKKNPESSSKGNKLFAVYLTNLITNIRIWRALNSDLESANMKIISNLLKIEPSVGESCKLCSTDGSVTSVSHALSAAKAAICSFGLDNSQKQAVLSCVKARGCYHQNTVKLIWGPPGTGKTKTVASLLYALLKLRCRTLTCAPTNIAVLGVTERLMTLVRQFLLHDTYGLGDLVLFGNGERMKIDDHDELFDVFLDNRVSSLCICFAPLTGWKGSVESMIALLEEPEEQYRLYLERSKDDEGNKDNNNEVEEEEEHQIDEIDLRAWEKGQEEKEEAMKLKNPSNTEKGKAFSKIIAQTMRENKKLNDKDASQRSTGAKCGEQQGGDCYLGEHKDKTASKKVPLWTFEEYVTERFKRIREKLMFCITSLYTHLPTSFISVDTVQHMILAQASLEVLQTLLNKVTVMNKGLREALRGVETEGITHEVQAFCLKNACLIFCTASSSSKLHKEWMTPLELLIIDEAAQLKECESTIPLQLSGIRHAVLVGDEKQLPAMVQSEFCKKADFGRSLFERLVILGQEKHLLSVQYRMHPLISLFPNMEFYDKKILDADNVKKKSYAKNYLEGRIYGPLSFINVSGGNEEFGDKHSLKNVFEAAVVAEIVANLYKESRASRRKVRVGCISPYKAQVSAIQEKLGQTYRPDGDGDFSVSVRSVDGFQGGEEDVIIISTVRCNGRGKIGFLSNCQRANVALTRARHCLWILGHGTTLTNSGSIWKKLVTSCQARGFYYDATADSNLAQAINNTLVDVAHLDRLLDGNSILFKTAKWKVCFNIDFSKSMSKLKDREVRKEVLALLNNLSEGRRRQVTDEDCKIYCTDGPSSLVLELYDVRGLKLIWSIDILREDGKDIQVIKIWDILPRVQIKPFAERLDSLFGDYTMDKMSRCQSKCIEGGLVLPISWLVDSNAVRTTPNTWRGNYESSLVNRFAGLGIRGAKSGESSRYHKYPASPV